MIELTARLEIELESQRQIMAGIPDAEPYAMFQRIDRDLDGLIQPLDILKFLRENDAY